MANIKELRGSGYKAAREACDLTLEQAAEAIGVAPRTLQSWESGKTEPRLYKFMALVDLYHASPDALARGSYAPC